jgi:hypothetical protein
MTETLNRRAVVSGTIAFGTGAVSSRAVAQAVQAPTALQIDMSRLTITEKLMHSTLRLVTLRGNVVGFGSGFIFGFPAGPGRERLVIVTNRHVVKNFDECRFRFTGMNPDGTANYRLHHEYQLTNLARSVIEHPDPAVDLAVIPIGSIISGFRSIGRDPFYASLDPSIIPSDDEIKALVPLQPIVTVGYPAGLIDDVNNLPIFHRGAAATAPYIDFRGKTEFLIDIAAWPGSSGSPVFLYDGGMIFDPRKKVVQPGERLALLGVIYADFEMNTSGNIEMNDLPTATSGPRNPVNIGVCVKSRRILDFIPILDKLPK